MGTFVMTATESLALTERLSLLGAHINSQLKAYSPIYYACGDRTCAQSCSGSCGRTCSEFCAETFML